MNIVRKDSDAVNATITIEISKEDYAAQVEKALKDYRRKVSMPGFRPGMVPIGLVKKMYGKAVLAEEVNKLVSDALFNYVKENNIEILGEPLPNETVQKPIDFDTDEAFEFVFDIAITPEFTLELTKKDKVPYYDITVTQAMEDEQIEQYMSRFGEYGQAESVEERDMVKGTMREMSGKKINEDGLKVEDAVLMPDYIKAAASKKKFIDAKKGDKIVFNPMKAYDNEAEVASLLKIAKEEVANYATDFEFEIQEITRHQKAELNQELFDKVLGENSVKDETEFRTKVREGIAAAYIDDSEYKFKLDARTMLVEKLNGIEFPDAFLKRWVSASNEKMSEETIEKDYPLMLEDLKWMLLRNRLAQDFDCKVEREDLDAYARKVARTQFAQYGMTNVPNDILENYATEMLKKEDSVRSFYEKALDEKVLDQLKEKIEIDHKEITFDAFNKMFEAQQ